MANEYKDTTNLPHTEFPMRGNLAKAEPERLKAWEQANVYELARKQNAGHYHFVLHDGPPYANGPIHLGHALNKITKDIVNRFHIMRGDEVDFIPGWDCHGQPIEHKVEETLGTKKFNDMPVSEVRSMCADFAVKNIDLQKEGFRRLGVLADWDEAYLTLTHDHDAADIEVFKRFWDRGALYKGRKPVYWCTHCHTALSEAEIEYHDIEGPSIFVAFAIKNPDKNAAFKDVSKQIDGSINFAIWTTTPWTLPANAAVALKPEETYVVLVHNDNAYIVQKDLVESFATAAGWDVQFAKTNDGTPLEIAAEDLSETVYRHPVFDDVEGRAILADYVTTTTGTGIVHIAPGHGVDDYYAGLKNNIDVIMPVADDGTYYKGEGYGTGGPWSGMNVWKANPFIIAFLKEQGTLLTEQKITHSYPHCWRCENPVIFRATEQWFVSMDKTSLREKALAAIENEISWFPSSSVKRMRAMVQNRPDWCLSRQRLWGVPIPSFTCEDCGTTVINDEILDAVTSLFREKGSDAWFTENPVDYLGDLAVCPKCGGKHLIPDKDILDVWWDSGVSHTAVLKKRENLKFPADLYVEGSDQHRGWFQSSLLTAMGAYDEAPYNEVLTLGFTLDGQGRKMSKSLGNVIDPQKICDTLGADIIRLWVASVDATQDMPCDQEILNRVSDAYRRFRNTFRFLLGELEEQFDYERDGVSFEEMELFDRLIVCRVAAVHKEVEKAYAEYHFNSVYRLLYDFVVTELSNGYLNATKDRMYCDGANSTTRRSAQTAWYFILAMLLSDLQPILCYTTDEVLAYVPMALRQGKDYAALLSWFEAPVDEQTVSSFAPVYEVVLAIREAYTKAYEEALSADAFEEKTTQATHAVITLPQDMMETLAKASKQVNTQLSREVMIAEVLVASDVELKEGEELMVEVVPATGEKCPRCWNWRELMDDGLCKRCHEVVANLNV